MLITYLALNYYLLYLLYLHIEVYVIYMVIRVGDGSFKYLFEKNWGFIHLVSEMF